MRVCAIACVLLSAATAHASGMYGGDFKDCMTVAEPMRGLFEFPSGATAYSSSPKLVPTWLAPAGKWGIKALFDSTCVGCHIKPPDGTATTSWSTEYTKYNACANCHRGTGDSVGGVAGTYPPNLDFFPTGNEVPPALMMRSYYSPGLSKAAASLIRVYEGTMPPQHIDYAYAPGDTLLFPTQARGWCYQITMNYKAWVDAGYPIGP